MTFRQSNRMRKIISPPAIFLCLLLAVYPAATSHAGTTRDWAPNHSNGFFGGQQVTPPDGRWIEVGPPSRIDHVAIFDPAGDRHIIFGGYTNNVWSLSSSPTQIWSELEVTGTAPPPRTDHSAIYDPVGNRMIVFGGKNPWSTTTSAFRDVWSLSLGPNPTWTDLTPSGTGPVPRYGHTTIYDPTRHRMVVHAGTAPSFGALADSWELDLGATPSWSSIIPKGAIPPLRTDHAAVYDQSADRMLVIGGLLEDEIVGRDSLVWSFQFGDSSVWSSLQSTGFPPQNTNGQYAVYDAAGNRVLFTSTIGSPLAGIFVAWEMRLLDPLDWRQITTTSNAPRARTSYSTSFDSTRQNILTHGGRGDATTQNRTLLLDVSPGLASWDTLNSASPPPRERFWHGSAYDPVGDRVLVVGGLPSANGLVLAGVKEPMWTDLGDKGFPHSGVEASPTAYDPLRDRMLMISQPPPGISFQGTAMYALNLRQSLFWETLESTGSPTGWTRQSMIYDPRGDRVLVFGGVPRLGLTNEVWEVLMASGKPIWRLLTPLGVPPSSRADHTAIYESFGHRMLVFAGEDFSGLQSDVWELSLIPPVTWTKLNPSGTPPDPRHGHVASYDPVENRMLVHGGRFATGSFASDVWELSLDAAPVWKELTPEGSLPAPRSFHSMAYDPVRDQLVLHAGIGAFRWSDSWIWLLDRPDSVRVDPSPPSSFAMEKVVPNPARCCIAVTFSLPSSEPATLDLIDVRGRVLVSEHVSLLGAGTHQVDFTRSSSISAGVYWVRLTQGQNRSLSKVVFLP